MYHPLPRDWLLATNKIEIAFSNGYQQKEVHGSGFWVRDAENSLVFVTNRHVLDFEYSTPKYLGQGYNLHSMRILTFDVEGDFGSQEVACATILKHCDNRIDLALLRNVQVPNRELFKVTPVELGIIATDQFLHMELEWGANVSFTSFQPWRDGNTERPILRTGVLSSDPNHAFELMHVRNKEVFLLEAMSFSGSSGSPVFANAMGVKVGTGLSSHFRPAKIIGIMSGHLQSYEEYRTHTGLSYCHKSDVLLKMLFAQAPLNSHCWVSPNIGSNS